MNAFDQGAQTAQNLQFIRDAVASGNGKEAKRLADKYKVPNELRMGMGVELTDGIPRVSIG